ncbi:MAG TPA: NAD(P)(+) transhydrogenase (Re/Si-specific) subunit alpha, partial [Chthoniobacteraceae bacterium]|nr:NAD(P)(+) transhydrogenase (Re/Si-specific) subunit alpha [Chthoniobacteraceae bacterium]
MPATVAKLAALGAEIEAESGLGAALHISDGEYRAAGAAIAADRRAALAAADLVLRLRKPPAEEVALMKRGGIHIG